MQRKQGKGKGYDGYSMSVNARLAYARGEKTLSKFKAQDRDQFVALLKAHGYDVQVTVKQFKKMIDRFAFVCEHHTSKHYNATDFYHVAQLFDAYTEDEEVLAGWETRVDGSQAELAHKYLQVSLSRD